MSRTRRVSVPGDVLDVLRKISQEEWQTVARWHGEEDAFMKTMQKLCLACGVFVIGGMRLHLTLDKHKDAVRKHGSSSRSSSSLSCRQDERKNVHVTPKHKNPNEDVVEENRNIAKQTLEKSRLPVLVEGILNMKSEAAVAHLAEACLVRIQPERLTDIFRRICSGIFGSTARWKLCHSLLETEDFLGTDLWGKVSGSAMSIPSDITSEEPQSSSPVVLNESKTERPVLQKAALPPEMPKYIPSSKMVNSGGNVHLTQSTSSSGEIIETSKTNQRSSFACMTKPAVPQPRKTETTNRKPSDKNGRKTRAETSRNSARAEPEPNIIRRSKPADSYKTDAYRGGTKRAGADAYRGGTKRAGADAYRGDTIRAPSKPANTLYGPRLILDTTSSEQSLSAHNQRQESSSDKDEEESSDPWAGTPAKNDPRQLFK